jgi:hypothetical protein
MSPFVGSSIEYLSGSSDFTAGLGITALLAGRVIYGVGCGWAMHGVSGG